MPCVCRFALVRPAQAAHLLQCTDKAKHRAYAKRKREEEAAAAAKAAKTDAQDAASSRAAFDFLGGRTQDVWRMNEAVRRGIAAILRRRALRAIVSASRPLLCCVFTVPRTPLLPLSPPVPQALKQMASEYGLSTDGTHEKLVTRIVRHRNALESSHLLTDGAEGAEGPAAAGGRKGGGGKLTKDSLPENLEMASEELLRAVRARESDPCLPSCFVFLTCLSEGVLANDLQVVPSCTNAFLLSLRLSKTCAAHGLKPRGGKLATKRELIRVIEKELYKDHEDVLFLE